MVRHRDHDSYRADRHGWAQRLLSGLVLLAGLLTASGVAAADRPIVGYLESWWEVPAFGANATRLAALPGYVDVVMLAFARPDARYRGDLDLSGTGLQFPYSGTILRDAIAVLRRRHPAVTILISVGGSNYNNWDRLNPQALAQLVGDIGADGLDIDFEPTTPGCSAGKAGSWRCASDRYFRDYVNRLRAALPRPAKLTLAGWSVGAYGQGAWADAPPKSAYRGLVLDLFAAPEAAKLDLVTIMAYEAGASYDPLAAFQAYRSVWPGPLALGVQVPLTGREVPRYTDDLARMLATRVANDPKGAMMVYGLFGRPRGTIGPDNPDGRMLTLALCQGLGRVDCVGQVP